MNIRNFAAAPTKCCFVVLATVIWASPSRAQVDKWADPPYLALSQNMTPAVKALPEFGEIEWTLERIPFIDDSPAAPHRDLRAPSPVSRGLRYMDSRAYA